MDFALQTVYSTVFAYPDTHYGHSPDVEEKLFRDSEIDAAELKAIFDNKSGQCILESSIE